MIVFTARVYFQGKPFADFEGHMGGATLSPQSIVLKENSTESKELFYKCVDYVSRDYYFRGFEEKPLYLVDADFVVEVKWKSNSK